MVSNGETASAEEQRSGRLWISVAEPVRLRDYFLRLGAKAEIVEGASGPLVHVQSADFEIAEFLDSWVAINQTQASIVQHQLVTLTHRPGAAAPPPPPPGDPLAVTRHDRASETCCSPRG